MWPPEAGCILGARVTRHNSHGLPVAPTSPQADWIYMAETDYVFMKPLALPRELKPGYDGWAYPFNYINAQANKVGE